MQQHMQQQPEDHAHAAAAAAGTQASSNRPSGSTAPVQRPGGLREWAREARPRRAAAVAHGTQAALASAAARGSPARQAGRPGRAGGSRRAREPRRARARQALASQAEHRRGLPPAPCRGVGTRAAAAVAAALPGGCTTAAAQRAQAGCRRRGRALRPRPQPAACPAVPAGAAPALLQSPPSRGGWAGPLRCCRWRRL